MNLIQLQKELGTEEQCLAYIEKARWPEGVSCLRCGSVRISRITTTSQGKHKRPRQLFECVEKECGHQFSATTGTLFQDTHLALTLWFTAIAVFVEAKKSVSALQMKRTLGLGSYKTAWHLCHRIREAMQEGGAGIFGGTLEMDETYIGGKYDKRRKRAKYDKQPVFGIIQRGTATEKSKVKLVKVDEVTKATLLPILHKNIAQGATLYTDQAALYKQTRKDLIHAIVNHSAKEYVRGDVHTNGIEGVWSLFNRAVVGSWHQITIKHMHRYLAETEFKFNGRGGDLFGQTITRLVNKPALPMAELVSDPKKTS